MIGRGISEVTLLIWLDFGECHKSWLRFFCLQMIGLPYSHFKRNQNGCLWSLLIEAWTRQFSTNLRLLPESQLGLSICLCYLMAQTWWQLFRGHSKIASLLLQWYQSLKSNGYFSDGISELLLSKTSNYISGYFARYQPPKKAHQTCTITKEDHTWIFLFLSSIEIAKPFSQLIIHKSLFWLVRFCRLRLRGCISVLLFFGTPIDRLVRVSMPHMGLKGTSCQKFFFTVNALEYLSFRWMLHHNIWNLPLFHVDLSFFDHIFTGVARMLGLIVCWEWRRENHGVT